MAFLRVADMLRQVEGALVFEVGVYGNPVNLIGFSEEISQSDAKRNRNIR